MLNKNNSNRMKMKPKKINHGSTKNPKDNPPIKEEVIKEENIFSNIEEDFNPFKEDLSTDSEFEIINPFGSDNDLTEEIDFPHIPEKKETQDDTIREFDFDQSIKSDIETKPESAETLIPKSKLELLVDPETSYFFVFGATTAGKSVMMSGLSYYMKAINEGQLRTCSDESLTNHKKGEYVLQDMTRRVKKGEFVPGTGRLEKTDNVFPTEINLEYIPQDRSKYSMPFCILEMAGEDLQELNITAGGKSGGKLDERISAYLHHPDCGMAFICVVDPDRPDESEELIERFINYTHKIGREENPILISVNKWDKVKAKYNNDVNEYFEKEIPILNKKTKDPDREYTKMGFSIGETEADGQSYKYNHTDSEKLFKWMYECATDTSIDDTQKASFFSRIFNSNSKK